MDNRTHPKTGEGLGQGLGARVARIVDGIKETGFCLTAA
jgi:hypothetical protein